MKIQSLGKVSRTYVSRKANGLGYIEDESTMHIMLNEKLFKANNDEAILQIFYHELYHIIQYHLFDDSDIRKLSETVVPENKVTTYSPNQLELEAEVFTINMLGASYHSCKKPKHDPLYQSTINTILKRTCMV